MMNKRLIQLLTAIATDSRMLADYQNDPVATMARFGLSRARHEGIHRQSS